MGGRSLATGLPTDRSATENDLLATSLSVEADDGDIRLLRFSMPEMKRASSVPTATTFSPKSSRSTASSKPLFRIELPTLNSLKLQRPFLDASKPRSPASAAPSECGCGCGHSGTSQFHGFTGSDQDIASLRNTPLTPPDEISFNFPNMTKPEHNAVDTSTSVVTQIPDKPTSKMQGLCPSIVSASSDLGTTEGRPDLEHGLETGQLQSETLSSKDLSGQNISAPSSWLDDVIDIACKCKISSRKQMQYSNQWKYSTRSLD